MARKPYEEEHDNHERWLVSYADFITLLFAFFVVMYALSSINEGNYRILSNSLLNAFGGTPAAAAPDLMVLPVQLPQQAAPPRQSSRIQEALRRERERLTMMARNILKVLAPLVDQGKVRVIQTDLGVTVEINASVLFAPGDAKLTEQTSKVLREIAFVLKDDDHALRIEGHTDSVRIGTPQFPSNWELSSARASSVVRLFIDNGIGEERLVAVGYAATRPVDTNDTAEGRLRNRRVSVMILSSLPEHSRDVPLSQHSGT